MEIYVILDRTSSHHLVERVRKMLEVDGEEKVEIDGLTFVSYRDGIQTRIYDILGPLPPALDGVPIKLVRIREKGKSSAPRLGYYRFASAEGTVSINPHAFLGRENPEGWELKVSAPTFDAAKQLYIEMKHSKAHPARSWSADENVPVDGATMLDTLSPFASEKHKTQIAVSHLRRKLSLGEITMNELITALHQVEL